MKIEVNVSKKYFIGILGAILILAGVIGVMGYNANWRTNFNGNPAVLGHSPDEVDGLEEYIAGIVEDIVDNSGENPTGTCTIISNSDTGTTSTTVKDKKDVAISVPGSCTSANGCTIKQEIYNKDGLKDTRVYTYVQDSSSGAWTSSYSTGRNGDSSASDIIRPYDTYCALRDTTGTGCKTWGYYLHLWDDRSATEVLSTQWTVHDGSDSHGTKIFICS